MHASFRISHGSQRNQTDTLPFLETEKDCLLSHTMNGGPNFYCREFLFVNEEVVTHQKISGPHLKPFSRCYPGEN